MFMLTFNGFFFSNVPKNTSFSEGFIKYHFGGLNDDFNESSIFCLLVRIIDFARIDSCISDIQSLVL